jgi:alkanesulfonate monooxygenase SsuD/methylene tetrahydromethanopterin reductase-like flavin-dependent oxidoreductase (luciferase family)
VPEFHLFLPQMRMAPDVLVGRARAAEAAGFTGIALMDHLAPPFAEDQPMYEAIPTAAWLAAHTERLVIGHLVLCDRFREPAVLARQAVTLDHMSGGRFELGIGAGSVPEELETFGMGGDPRRVARLEETLEVVTRLWSGEPVDYDGRFYTLRGAQQLPVPTRKIPIVIGAVGPRMMELVARHADWWNLPGHQLDRLDELLPVLGGARPSMQQPVAFAPKGEDLDEVLGLARQRLRWSVNRGLVAGTGPELVERFGALHERGVERFYTWFSDFAVPDTLAAFGSEVIGAL